MSSTSPRNVYLMSQAAQVITERTGHHVHYWQLVRVFSRGLLPPARRAGQFRVLLDEDLPAVVAALRRAGYLPPAVEGGSDAD